VGSKTQNPRFMTPDIFSGRIAISPDYGVRMRWVAIVTDAEIAPTEPLVGFDPCADCAAPCITACPVAALSGEATERARERCWAARDLLRCDWAKRYALVGDEGIKWMGSTTDIPPPDGEITAQDIAAATHRRDPVQRHLDCILEPCLKACHRVLQEKGIG